MFKVILQRAAALWVTTFVWACGPEPKGVEAPTSVAEVEAVGQTVQGLGSGQYGWVWTRDGSGTVGSAYNSSLGGVSVSRSGLGRYQVTFFGLTGGSGHVQVVSEGDNPNRCKTSGWYGNPLRVNVVCFSPFGAAVDSNFVAVFSKSAAGGTQRWAYAWANQPTAFLYTPSPSYQAHHDGRSVTISRLGTGRYRVYMYRLVQGNGNVQVTAYGSSSEYCNVGGIYQGYVDVNCWNTNNQAADTRFTVAYMCDGALLAPQSQRGLYFHADRPTANFPYIPARAVVNPNAATPEVVPRSGGRDHIRVSPANVSLRLADTATLVTAYNAGTSYCKPMVGTSGYDLDVKCFLRLGGGATIISGNYQYMGHAVSKSPIF